MGTLQKKSVTPQKKAGESVKEKAAGANNALQAAIAKAAEKADKALPPKPSTLASDSQTKNQGGFNPANSGGISNTNTQPKGNGFAQAPITQPKTTQPKTTPPTQHPVSSINRSIGSAPSQKAPFENGAAINDRPPPNPNKSITPIADERTKGPPIEKPKAIPQRLNADMNSEFRSAGSIALGDTPPQSSVRKSTPTSNGLANNNAQAPTRARPTSNPTNEPQRFQSQGFAWQSTCATRIQ